MGNALPVIICDDSGLARKQMERALSPWNIDVTHAKHGLEALEAIRAGKGELLFLDLNMPIMDGYEVLERIQTQDLPVLTIVVSGDIQPEAHARVRKLGALDFIQKPIDIQQLSRSLSDFGLLQELAPTAAPTLTAEPRVSPLLPHRRFRRSNRPWRLTAITRSWPMSPWVRPPPCWLS